MGSIPYFLWLLFLAVLDAERRKELKIRSKLELTTELQALAEAGKLKPVIGKTFPLNEVPAAMRCMQAGMTLGRIVIIP